MHFCFFFSRCSCCEGGRWGSGQSLLGATHTHTHTLFVVVVDIVGTMLVLFSFLWRRPSLLPHFLSHPTAEKKRGGECFLPPAHLIKVLVDRRREEKKKKKNGMETATYLGRTFLWGWIGAGWTEARSPKHELSPRGRCVPRLVSLRCFPVDNAHGNLQGQGRFWFGVKVEARCAGVSRKAPFWYHHC